MICSKCGKELNIVESMHCAKCGAHYCPDCAAEKLCAVCFDELEYYN